MSVHVINIVGLNRARLLNTFKGGGVRLNRVAVLSPSETEVTVAKKDLPKAVAILDSLCYNYSVKSEPLGNALLRRLPLLLASALCAAAVFSSNLFVWRIEVAGAEGARLAEVLAVAAESGARAGVPKAFVDTAAVTAALRQTSGISSASVSYHGNSLKISVLTSYAPEPPDPSGTELVSGYDGVITRLVVESGTPLVQPGDVVKRGDVLISGNVFSTLDGTLIGQTEVRGSVYARVTFNYSYPVRSTSTLVTTGNTYVATALSLFGLTIGGGEPPFELYESESTTSRLFPLPIAVTRTVYREIGAAEAVGAAEEFMAEKAEELTALYGCEFEQRYSTVNMGGVAVVKAYFTAEIRIGEI